MSAGAWTLFMGWLGGGPDAGGGSSSLGPVTIQVFINCPGGGSGDGGGNGTGAGVAAKAVATILANQSNQVYVRVTYPNGYAPFDVFAAVGKPTMATFADARPLGWATAQVINGVLHLYNPVTGTELATGQAVGGCDIWFAEEGLQ